MQNKLAYSLALILALVILLSSCGGGAKTKPPAPQQKPAAPTLNLDYRAVKVFSFSWTDVEGETGYKLFENEDGSGSFVELAGIPADSQSHELEVFLPARVNARYKLAACNAAGCSESAEVSVDAGQLVKAIGYFKASNTEKGDWFGASIALSADGNTLAVGATGEDSSATGINGNQNGGSSPNSGAVYVFVRSDTGNWTQQAYIKASNTGAGDLFGFAVSISSDGNVLAVGATGEDSSATGVGGDQSNNSASGSGAVYVFTRSGASWSQQAYIKASNTEKGDRFGRSLTLSANGDTLAVGAPFEASKATGVGGDQNDNSAPKSGAVYVFTRSGASWSQQAYMKASNTGKDDEFGSSLALSGDGNTLAVGAPGEDSKATGIGGDENDDSAPKSGAVYVFTRSGASWSQQAYVKASNTGNNDGFGFSLDLSANGNTLAVGANGEDSKAAGIDGNQSDNSTPGSGAVYVFTRSGASWSQQAYVKASNPGKNDQFGYTLALSGDGNNLAAGARYEGSKATGIGGDQSNNSASGSGAVYVFTRSGANWNQQTYVKASNTGKGDSFGSALALSGDGNTLAAGARYEGSKATGIGGDQSDNSQSGSGAVYVY